MPETEFKAPKPNGTLCGYFMPRKRDCKLTSSECWYGCSKTCDAGRACRALYERQHPEAVLGEASKP